MEKTPKDMVPFSCMYREGGMRLESGHLEESLAPLGIIERGVPRAYVRARARASSATPCLVHV